MIQLPTRRVRPRQYKSRARSRTLGIVCRRTVFFWVFRFRSGRRRPYRFPTLSEPYRAAGGGDCDPGPSPAPVRAGRCHRVPPVRRPVLRARRHRRVTVRLGRDRPSRVRPRRATAACRTAVRNAPSAGERHGVASGRPDGRTYSREQELGRERRAPRWGCGSMDWRELAWGYFIGAWGVPPIRVDTVLVINHVAQFIRFESGPGARSGRSCREVRQVGLCPVGPARI
jgi:hypothetical protein